MCDGFAKGLPNFCGFFSGKYIDLINFLIIKKNCDNTDGRANDDIHDNFLLCYISIMQLRVLTFNIHKGLNATSNKLILPKIRDLLDHIDADIVFLQEVQGEHSKRRDKFSDWPKIPQAEYLAGDKWPYYFYGENHAHDHGHHGNALLSKYPLNRSMNLDISSHRLSNRGLLYTQLLHPGIDIPIHLICTHFGLFKKERGKQFELLNKFIDDEITKNEPLLMAGDFNDWQSASFELLNKTLELSEVFDITHGSYAKSFPARFPLLKVDRIYFRHLIAQHCEIIKTRKMSDHSPLLAEFMLRDSPNNG